MKMRSMICGLHSYLGNFAKDTSGSLSIEAAMMAPLLCFAMFSTYTYFDIYRYDATLAKASYTAGDLISRETDPIDQDYLDGLYSVFEYIANPPNETWMRVTSVVCDLDDSVSPPVCDYVLQWSHVVGEIDPLDATTLEEIKDKIPNMFDQDTIIMLETNMDYSTPFNVGIAAFDYRNVVATRPRFTTPVCWETCT
jgi:hypothetical protein